MRPVPFFTQSSEDLLLLADGEVRILGVPLTISSLDEGDGVFGPADLRLNHLTFFQSPSRLDGILWMRGEPEIILIEVVEGDETFL